MHRLLLSGAALQDLSLAVLHLWLAVMLAASCSPPRLAAMFARAGLDVLGPNI